MSGIILDKGALVIRLCGGFCDRTVPEGYARCPECQREKEVALEAEVSALKAELKTLKGKTFYELHRDLALRMIEGTASPEDLAKLARVREVLEIQSNHQTVERWRELEAEISALKAENVRLSMDLNATGAMEQENERLTTALRMETERVAVAVEAEREACARLAGRVLQEWLAACVAAQPKGIELPDLAEAIRGRRP